MKLIEVTKMETTMENWCKTATLKKAENWFTRPIIP